MPDLENVEAEAIISRPKFVAADLSLVRKKQQANYLLAVARVHDDREATIAGLTVAIEVKAPVRFNVCRSTASLYLLRDGVTWRVHQLEIQPASRRSHNDTQGPLFGPHEHRGERVLSFTAPPLDCDTPVDTLFRVFCQIANIEFTGSISLP